MKITPFILEAQRTPRFQCAIAGIFKLLYKLFTETIRFLTALNAPELLSVFRHVKTIVENASGCIV